MKIVTIIILCLFVFPGYSFADENHFHAIENTITSFYELDEQWIGIKKETTNDKLLKFANKIKGEKPINGTTPFQLSVSLLSGFMKAVK
jgi:hypothetical protein